MIAEKVGCFGFYSDKIHKHGSPFNLPSMNFKMQVGGHIKKSFTWLKLTLKSWSDFMTPYVIYIQRSHGNKVL